MLGQRQPGHHTFEPLDRDIAVAASPRDLGEPSEVRDVGRICIGATPVGGRSLGDLPIIEGQLAELEARPGDVGAGTRDPTCGSHRRLGAAHVAQEFARVGDPRIRPDVGQGVDHALIGAEGRVVAAELELRVSDDAVDGGVPGRRRTCLPPPLERSREVVSGRHERSHADQRLCVLFGLQRQRAIEDAFGFGVEAGVERDAGLLYVGESEARQSAGIVGVGS